MATFFISDTHFGHGNIIKYCDRPFLKDVDKKALADNGGKWDPWPKNKDPWRISRDAVDMMNDHFTDEINKMVGENDTLWHLGDWAFARKDDYYRKCRFYRDRIICQDINIIWGNHDQPEKIRDLFNQASTLNQIKVEKTGIVLCHYLMAVWNNCHRGNWHLYGHSHSGAEPWADEYMSGRRSFDVGVDNAKKLLGEYRPFSMEDIRELMKNRPGFSMDHHKKRK
jgi:calcineurin-like phosphoesterase family protein